MKYIAVLFIAGALAVSVGVQSASALSVNEQIQSLLAQVAALQERIRLVSSGSAVTAPASPVVVSSEAPAHCKVWYDGCNTCSRESVGSPLMCTMMYCFQNAGAYCKEYFNTTGGLGSSLCALSSNPPLSRGSRGAVVSMLQEFLNQEGLLFVSPTGYFGVATEQALKAWQSREGIVGIGSPWSTGWGLLGPRTWDALRLRCGGGGGTGCGAEYAPVCGRPTGCSNTCPPGMACAMYCQLHEPRTYSNSCLLNAAGAEYLYNGACTTSGTNNPPSISGVSGPTTLSLNEVGTWSVQASDPENQQLSYSITWGDEYAYPMMMDAAVSSPSYMQTSTFTHQYRTAGTYTVRVTVTDSMGQSAVTSITVSVGQTPVACTMEYAPVCGQKTACPACTNSYPACLAPCSVQYQTYSNRCMLNADGAAFLYSGACMVY